MAHALSLLGWMELPEEDQPPQQIWLDQERLSAHFEAVNDKHRAKANGTEDVPEATEMADNEMLKGLRR